MTQPAVELRVAGKTYQVVTSAAEDELRRLAARVEDALAEVVPEGREASSHSLVLAAITLAHELEEERTRRLEAEAHHRRVLSSLLGRIDRVLDESEEVLVPAGKKSSGNRHSTRGPDAK